jgi:hypothetical protein
VAPFTNSRIGNQHAVDEHRVVRAQPQIGVRPSRPKGAGTDQDRASPLRGGVSGEPHVPSSDPDDRHRAATEMGEHTIAFAQILDGDFAGLGLNAGSRREARRRQCDVGRVDRAVKRRTVSYLEPNFAQKNHELIDNANFPF